MTINPGDWTFELDLGETSLPFRAKVNVDEKGQPSIIMYNAAEEIVAQEISTESDSMIVRIPHFESEFHAHLEDNGKRLAGFWRNFAKGPDYKIPFTAVASPKACASTANGDKAISIGGRWETTFGEPDDTWPAIGEFTQDGNAISGTFLTETGDYRFLEGCLTGDNFLLTTFDGAHAFAFAGTVDGDGNMKGTFYSGNHYQTPFSAVRNEEAKLRAADSLTYLKEGYDGLAFSFPDLDGNMVSLTDDRFKGKAVIVQIMGSWCPNCLDETRLYNEWYKRYKGRGLEIVALAYEASTDPVKAGKAINRFRKPLGETYTFLIAGRANKKESAASLPMLNHIISYPTSIFIDKTGNIRSIHTGFSGPGTGKHYDEFVEKYERLIEDML